MIRRNSINPKLTVVDLTDGAGVEERIIRKFRTVPNAIKAVQERIAHLDKLNEVPNPYMVINVVEKVLWEKVLTNLG